MANLSERAMSVSEDNISELTPTSLRGKTIHKCLDNCESAKETFLREVVGCDYFLLVANPKKHTVREIIRMAREQGERFIKWKESGEPLQKVKFFYRKDDLKLISADRISCDWLAESVGINFRLNDIRKSFFEAWHCDENNKPNFPLYRIPLKECMSKKAFYREKLRDDILVDFELRRVGDDEVVVRVSYDKETARNFVVPSPIIGLNDGSKNVRNKFKFLQDWFALLQFIHLARKLRIHHFLRISKVVKILIFGFMVSSITFYISNTINNASAEIPVVESPVNSDNLSLSLIDLEDSASSKEVVVTDVVTASEDKSISNEKGSFQDTKRTGIIAKNKVNQSSEQTNQGVVNEKSLDAKTAFECSDLSGKQNDTVANSTKAAAPTTQVMPEDEKEDCFPQGLEE